MRCDAINNSFAGLKTKLPPAKMSVHPEEHKILVREHGKYMDGSLGRQDTLPKGPFSSEKIHTLFHISFEDSPAEMLTKPYKNTPLLP